MTSVTVQQVLAILDDFAPFNLAAEWDNVGLLIGEPQAEVSGILLALDPSRAVLEEAEQLGHNTIITHHPLLFHALKEIRTDTPQGRMVRLALRQGLQIIACHTNLDVVPDGVSDQLGRLLGLVDCRPLQPSKLDSQCGFGRLGRLPQAVEGKEYLNHLAQVLGQPELLVAGPVPQLVQQVAVCGGSCGDMAQLALEQGAQLFVTSELKHSVARWAEDAGICLVDGGHFSTEQIALPALQQRLQAGLAHELVITMTSRQQRPLQGYTLRCGTVE